MVDKLIARMEEVIDTDEFEFVMCECVNQIKAGGVGTEAIEPLLRFMERHPLSEFGCPGAVVHFIEHFNDGTYEKLLAQSFTRRPTVHTAWTMNRVINGEEDDDSRQMYINVMKDALERDDIESEVKHEIQNYLDHQE